MTREESIQELVRLVMKVDQYKQEKRIDGAVDNLKVLLKKNGNKRLIDDFIAAQLRKIFSKDKLTVEEKELGAKLLSLSLDLSSDELVAALKKHDELKKYIKEKLVEVIKMLVTMGIMALK
jgi:hypothetical protein